MNSKSQRGRTDSRHDDQADDRDDDFTDDLLARRRAKRSAASQRNAIIIAGVAGLLVIGGVVGLVAYLLKKPAGQGNGNAVAGGTTRSSTSEPGPGSSLPIASSNVKALIPAAGVPAAVGIGGPSAAKEGETWTPGEMFQFLKGKGIVVEMVPIRPSGSWGGPMIEMKTANGLTLTLLKESSASAARDTASLVEKKLWSWGRFCLGSENADLVKQVRAALE